MSHQDLPSSVAASDSPKSSPSASEGEGPTRGIRVILAARVRLYREGLRESLQRHRAFEFVAACATAEELLRVASGEPPPVVILDMSLCEDRPLAREILAAVPDARILALAVDDRQMEAVLECATAGMAGWVGNDATVEELARAVEHVARGELMCSARHAALLYGRVADLLADRPPSTGAAALTARERDVGILLAKGISNKGISRALGIEIATVKNHVHNILAKLEVGSRSEAGARLAQTVAPSDAPIPDQRLSTPARR